MEVLQTVVTDFVSPHQSRPQLSATIMAEVCQLLPCIITDFLSLIFCVRVFRDNIDKFTVTWCESFVTLSWGGGIELM